MQIYNHSTILYPYFYSFRLNVYQMFKFRIRTFKDKIIFFLLQLSLQINCFLEQCIDLKFISLDTFSFHFLDYENLIYIHNLIENKKYEFDA